MKRDTTVEQVLFGDVVNEWHDIRAEQDSAKAVDWSGIPDRLKDRYEIYASQVPDPISFDEWLNS